MDRLLLRFDSRGCEGVRLKVSRFDSDLRVLTDGRFHWRPVWKKEGAVGSHLGGEDDEFGGRRIQKEGSAFKASPICPTPIAP